MRHTLLWPSLSLAAFCLVGCAGGGGENPASSVSSSSVAAVSSGSNSSGAAMAEGCNGSSDESVFESPTVVSESDITRYFSGLGCGVGFSALGAGLYNSSYRTMNGEARYVDMQYPDIGVTHVFNRVVTWRDTGLPVTNILKIAVDGIRWSGTIIITDSGQVYAGREESIFSNPIINSGAFAAAAGFWQACIITKTNHLGQVWCYSDLYGSDIKAQTGLPADFDAIQLASDDSTRTRICALSTKGKVWCWDWQGDTDFSAPYEVKFKSPVKAIAVQQESPPQIPFICGIKFTGGIECSNGWESSDYRTGNQLLLNDHRVTLLGDNGEVHIYNMIDSPTQCIKDNIIAMNKHFLQSNDGKVYLLRGYESKTVELISDINPFATDCPF
jgi:hypothetical protein